MLLFNQPLDLFASLCSLSLFLTFHTFDYDECVARADYLWTACVVKCIHFSCYIQSTY